MTFHFAVLAREGEGEVAIDTSKISDHAGMEISDFLGANTLRQVTTHIDYRDGLVKFDFNPKHAAISYRALKCVCGQPSQLELSFELWPVLTVPGVPVTAKPPTFAARIPHPRHCI